MKITVKPIQGKALKVDRIINWLIWGNPKGELIIKSNGRISKK